MCHVLVIEDEWLLAEYISDIVERAGATSIDTATTEAEAIKAAIAHKPDVIMSDVVLAAGHGPHAVQTIFAKCGEVPVIFITGTPADCHPCNPPGVVFGKPINERRVMEAFREAIAA
ncbi:CheY-like chemotaxis protein [Sphingomonas sp. BE138]|uniref:response regulator n=1 Tax=Sphingomonas sp. BE138 TaxID=2817845 RepID=UPI0028551894|nr:response regulator [Sphingomonas sp. BE138]MDR6789155.1 CheY-like chemotaxis protein [Sphingomonas sp. BE138]